MRMAADAGVARDEARDAGTDRAGVARGGHLARRGAGVDSAMGARVRLGVPRVTSMMRPPVIGAHHAQHQPRAASPPARLVPRSRASSPRVSSSLSLSPDREPVQPMCGTCTPRFFAVSIAIS